MSYKRKIAVYAMVAILAFLSGGCREAQRQEQTKIHSFTTETDNDISSDESSPYATTYMISGKQVKLDVLGVDGKVSLLTSASGELNGDGRKDKAVILVLNSVGAGVFYHLNLPQQHVG